jgi:hypothetical protein
MLLLLFLLLDVPIAPYNATIVPPISCTSLLPFDAVVAPHNVTIVRLVSSNFCTPSMFVAAPPIPNWCFPPLHVFASMGEKTSFPIQLFSSFKLLQAKLKGEFFFFSKCLFIGDFCSLF